MLTYSGSKLKFFLEHLGNYGIESIWQITASDDFLDILLRQHTTEAWFVELAKVFRILKVV